MSGRPPSSMGSGVLSLGDKIKGPSLCFLAILVVSVVAPRAFGWQSEGRAGPGVGPRTMRDEITPQRCCGWRGRYGLWPWMVLRSRFFMIGVSVRIRIHGLQASVVRACKKISWMLIATWCKTTRAVARFTRRHGCATASGAGSARRRAAGRRRRRVWNCAVVL